MGGGGGGGSDDAREARDMCGCTAGRACCGVLPYSHRVRVSAAWASDIVAWRGVAWRGVAWRGVAWRDVVGVWRGGEQLGLDA